MKNHQYTVGVDIGGTKVAVACVNTHGKIIQKLIYPTILQKGWQGVLANIVIAIDAFKASCGSCPSGIGVGIAGQVNSATGHVYFAPNLEWHDVPFGMHLNNALGVPVFVTNDVRAATYGEWKFGAGQNCNDVVCILIGTGIGGGIVANGQMLQGSSGTVGELGHIVLDINGPLCTCGNKGCFEAIAGGWGIAKAGNMGSAKEVIEAYKAGDSKAIAVIEKAKVAWVAGSVSIVHAFNPQKLIIGGGIANNFPEVVEWVRDGVRQKALKAATQFLEIVPSLLKDEAGLIGPAAMVLERKAV